MGWMISCLRSLLDSCRQACSTCKVVALRLPCYLRQLRTQCCALTSRLLRRLMQQQALQLIRPRGIS